jgi:hypothetical protein
LTAYNPFTNEDKALMAERQRLEIIWVYQLSDDDHAAWAAHFATRPPTDIFPRAYVTGTPTTMSQVHVSPATQWAWSQIYGTFRFNQPYVESPSDDPDTPPTLSNLTCDDRGGRLTIATLDTTPLPWQWILFTTDTLLPNGGNPRSRLRPSCCHPQNQTSEGWSFQQCYTYRWGHAPAPPFAVASAAVNANNELVVGAQTLFAT